MKKGILDAIQGDNSNTIKKHKPNSKQAEYGLLGLTSHSEKNTNEKHKTKCQIKGGLLDVATK